MIKRSTQRFAVKLVLLALLALPELAGAQFFNYNREGDTLIGFRKTGANAGNYELVVDQGSVTNLVKLTIGTTINITNYSPNVLTDTFSNDFGNIQWSVFSAFYPSPGLNSPPWMTGIGAFPKNTLWYTLPGTNVNTQTTPPLPGSTSGQGDVETSINSIGADAENISSYYLGVTNADNNAYLVREPSSYDSDGLTLSYWIGDYSNPSVGDFSPSPSVSGLGFTVENITPEPFTSAQRNDFYQLCPEGTRDPIAGTTNVAYYVGYFILNPNGTMTFTRAAASAPPPPPPTIGSVGLSGGNLVITGGNGTANAQYRVLVTTSLALPLASWTPIATNTFSGTGAYTFTNPITSYRAAFFRIVSP